MPAVFGGKQRAMERGAISKRSMKRSHAPI
jgi:hypothetical protein